MKKTKEQFAVKLWLTPGGYYVTVVKAFSKQEAYAIAQYEAISKYDTDDIHDTSIKTTCIEIKELPTCVIRSAFGRIPIKAVPNQFYDNEIIINDVRIRLPDKFRYWDINSITIHNAGFPVIATITTDKDTFIVQNNVDGCGKRFEIIK